MKRIITFSFAWLFLQGIAFGQTPEIEAAEKILNAARVDTLHPKQYALAIIELSKVYEDYIRDLPIAERMAHEILVNRTENEEIVENIRKWADKYTTYDSLDFNRLKRAEVNIKVNYSIFLTSIVSKYKDGTSLVFSQRAYNLMPTIEIVRVRTFWELYDNYSNYADDLSFRKQDSIAVPIYNKLLEKNLYCIDAILKKTDSTEIDIKDFQKRIIDIHYSLGYAYVSISKVDSAIYHAKKAIRLANKYKIRTDDSDLYNNLALLLSKKGLFDSAFAVLENRSNSFFLQPM